MEIEAKFTVPDQDTFRRLQGLEHLCGYELHAPQVHEVHDTYLDSADRRVLAAGYFCRRRESAQGILITLKALTPSAATAPRVLGGVGGVGEAQAVHRREEWEAPLPADVPVADWPPGPVRDHLLQWVGEAPLTALVELNQTRYLRAVMQGERTVAELCLDQVLFSRGRLRREALELEIELKGEGKEDDLATLASCLQTEWGLPAQLRSKFERALALLEATPRVGTILQPAERDILLRIAARGGRYGRRARALLAVDEGAVVREASQQAPLSPRRVRYWLRLLKDRRLDIFPSHVREAAVEQRAVDLAAQNAAGEAIAEQPAAAQIELADNPGIDPDDTMAEAARKTLCFHLQRMLYHESGTRLGTDIEELHDMRVATRRMRAALRVFRDRLNMKEMAPFAKGLRRTGRALGAVRDLDVFREKVQTYLDTLPAERKAELDPLLSAWQAQRERARQEMIAYLDSARYVRFKEQFSSFLQTPGAGALPTLTADGDLIPHRVRHVVPVIVQARLASVRAHGEWVIAPDAPLERFHCLRIASKELRYALEFFQEVLGPESKALVAMMKALQDHLGNLQDAVVACNLLRDFLTWGTWGHAPGSEQPWPTSPIVAPGVATYLAIRQTEIQTLVQTFPEVWAPIASRTFQKRLAAALRPLW